MLEVKMMSERQFSVSIIGCGNRGAETYGRLMAAQSDKFKIAALYDIDPEAVKKYSKIFNTDNIYLDEDEFFQKRHSDALVIASMDQDHVRQCVKAMELGYDILLEKPIASNEEDCLTLLREYKKRGNKIMVCHVLRYAPAFNKVKELISSGEYGKLIMIDSCEQVGYWHQAHSFVRGNWRNDAISPMILQKCCHDLDLLQYYAESKADSLSSIGELKHFNKQNQPSDASDRCVDCKYIDSCPYSAKNIYIKRWKEAGSPENLWPYNMLTKEIPLTEANLTKALEEGPYGRCVYACDNNVVDHQAVSITFENGVKALHKMIAFTSDGGRIMNFYCERGQIELNETRGTIEIRPFGKSEEKIYINQIIEQGHSHG
ncbi:MAG TPA: Gfo/Idh/MocA family oxidoreductase, partial [Clostridia bacterium]